MVLAWKNIGWHFLKPLAQLVLLAWNYRTFSQDKGPFFSTTVPFSKMQTVLPSKWRHRAKDTVLLGARLQKCGTFYSVLSGVDCCFRKINIKVYANQVQLLCCTVFKFLLRKDLLCSVCCYVQVVGALHACMYTISAYQCSHYGISSIYSF